MSQLVRKKNYIQIRDFIFVVQYIVMNITNQTTEIELQLTNFSSFCPKTESVSKYKKPLKIIQMIHFFP